MSDGDGADRDRAEKGSGTVGVLARLAVAAITTVLGIVWVVRLAIAGPAFGGGLLFELLGPLVLLYFGVDYIRTQRGFLRRVS